LVGAQNRRPLKIIDSVSGVLRPGRFTLVLAPPGSGKTTFLRVLVSTVPSAPVALAGAWSV
jgi:ABC-type multidrug transport system ATPase subunit